MTASRRGLDFADAVIAELGRAAGCDSTVTYDHRAARDGAMELLPPRRQSDSRWCTGNRSACGQTSGVVLAEYPSLVAPHHKFGPVPGSGLGQQ
jgi:hypothetical protein